MEIMGWKQRLRLLGWTERLFALLVLAGLAARYGAPDSAGTLLIQLLATVFGLVVLWRFLAGLTRRAIWRLRNRLIVAYLFIAVVPILMLAVLTLAGAWAISGQIAAYLLSVEMDRRVVSLRSAAESLGRLEPPARAEAMRRATEFFSERFPGVEMTFRDLDGKLTRCPEDAVLPAPPPGHSETSGLLVRNRVFYLWAHSVGPRGEAVIAVPVTRRFLQGLVPRLGDIQLTPLGPRADGDGHLHPPLGDEAGAPASGVPDAVNLADLPLKWGVSLYAADWSSPRRARAVFLGVATRISGPLRIMFGVDTSSQGPALLILFTVASLIFFFVETTSVWIGINLSRSITSAVNDLYLATVRIRDGDLSHRIQVTGNDQLAELGTSFNIMAGNLERLLRSEKERQKLQAELEIAREVQAQLHPKPLAGLGSLSIACICNAARMVSGDYFDYVPLSDRRLALAIGDVAGKGISAALLMATLQAALRSRLRPDPASPQPSTAAIVAELNQQLHASTAPEKYATFFLSVYDEDSATLSYTNAGHLSPILARDGAALKLDSNGMVVGAFPFAKYDESRIQLRSGDLLLFYTDGITEPENAYGEQFGEERLIELLLAHADLDCDSLAARIVEEVNKWTDSSELQDDMTLLVARKA
jgi:sigma-B regulation protein RsbU (phosphoserine phosphatase)